MESESSRPDHNTGFAHRLAMIPDLPRREYSGRGIVICAGGVLMFTNAWVVVWVLRKVLGCPLPIEVWHLGRSEMSSGMRQMLESLGANVVDARVVLSRFPARIADGWQLKPYALIMSRFREVLMLDADNVPAVDPAFLFDAPEYSRGGAVFWPDVLDLAATNPIWSEVGVPALQRTSFETGQILIDKARHGAALKVVLHLNEDAERYYKLIYGDKDTFLVGWLVAGSDYLLVSHRPFVDTCICYQRGFDGNVLFQHRTSAKWSYGGKQIKSDAFVHDAACEEALSELRRIWNGRIFEPPAQSLAALRKQRRMEGMVFIASRPGEEDSKLELLPGCQIGRGRSPDRETWYVFETEPGHFVLRIMNRHRLRHELLERDDDCWMDVGNTKAAMCLTAADSMVERDGADSRDFSFIRDLVDALLADGRWTEEMSDELRVTLTTLAKVDPSIANDAARYAASAQTLDDAARACLLDVAKELERTADFPSAPSVRSTPGMLSDRRFYVRP